MSVAPEWHGFGVWGESLVHVGPVRIVWATPLVTLKCPAHPTPFWSQNCGFATAVVPGEPALDSSSSGAFSSLESRLPLASDWYPLDHW